jgi:hypothetical protein
VWQSPGVIRPALLAAVLALVTLVALGCKFASQRTGEAATPRSACAAPAMKPAGWRHDRSRLMAATMSARHTASDVIAAPGAPLELAGKIVYGKLSKDLEDEEVVLWIEDGSCRATEVARGITDDDGRVAFTVPGREPGTYQFWIAVAGDATAAAGAIWVVPKGQRAVLFDVDGTLTTSDGELFEELAGAGPADMFPDADGVARYWADRGHVVIYVTGRPYLLQRSTRAWLDARGLPPGPLFTPARLRQAVPSHGGVGAYKTAVLTELAATVDIVRAYGNAETDVCAYAAGGIAPDRTYIVGKDAKRCDPHPATRPLPSYTDHLAELASDP